MKKIIQLSTLILLMGIIISGCEKIKSVADVEFDANFETDMDVVVTPTSSKSTVAFGNFSKTETIDPTTNADFLKYKDKIKDIEVQKVIVEVISISNAPGNVVQGQGVTLAILPQDAAITSAIVAITDRTLAIGDKVELTLTDTHKSYLQAIMNTKQPFTVRFAGMADPVDAGFRVKVYINTRITANALN